MFTHLMGQLKISRAGSGQATNPPGTGAPRTGRLPSCHGWVRGLYGPPLRRVKVLHARYCWVLDVALTFHRMSNRLD